MTDDELTKIIIGCAYKVHNTLGAGFLEKLYKKALCIELEKAGLSVRVEAPISVLYDGQAIGEYFADLWVENRIIVELKAVQSLNRDHEVQLVNYLSATGTESGLLLNFGSSVQVR
ncbi:MAG: GxxExxY protein [Blastocatellia bacterium]